MRPAILSRYLLGLNPGLGSRFPECANLVMPARGGFSSRWGVRFGDGAEACVALARLVIGGRIRFGEKLVYLFPKPFFAGTEEMNAVFSRLYSQQMDR